MIKEKWFKRFLTALCAVCLAVTAVAVMPAADTVKADNISLANGDFSSYSSTDYSPSNWTKSGDNNSEIFSGVYDGKAGYDEHGFENTGLLVHDNDYKDFLVFNSKSYTAYTAFSSADITLSPSSYYQFTVKAKADVSTGNAYFSITGLEDEEIAIPIVNDGIWATYKIYLATDFDTDDTVNVTLSLGMGEAKAKGWAMFDDVNVESLTVYDYSTILESDNILIYDISTPYTDGLILGGDFTVLDYENWTVGGDKTNASVSVISATHTEIPGQDATVAAPNFDGSTNNVLRIASNDDNGGYVTLTSNEFTVAPDEYYRVSYFVLDEGDTDSSGSGATAKLLYKYAGSPDEFKHVLTSNIQTATANASHFGWTERDFYIAGSSFTDTTVKIEFALGAEGSPVAGGVLIDDVRVQKLTPERYAELAPDSSLVADVDADITDNTGVTTGAFMSYTITDGKRVPDNWTQISAGSGDVASYGYSDAAVNTDNIDAKVVNSEDAVAANIDKYELALEMSSSTDTAFGMRSAAIAVESAAYRLITVDISAMQVSGYGANIVIRRDNGAVVTKLENITRAGEYSFCLKGDANSSVNVYVEVWLGLFDRNQNRDKLASGTLYVNSVASASSTQDVYDAYTVSVNPAQTAASVDYAEMWMAADSDNTLYNWTLTLADENAKAEYKATTLDDEEVIALTNLSPNASAITLTPAFTVTASTYYKVTVQLKISGSLDDVDTNLENYKGAWAGIIAGSYSYDTTPYTVKDIKETTSTTDSTNYMTLEFFIRGGESDSTASIVVGLGENIEVAEDEDPIPFTQGTVYIKGISVETSSTTEYTDAMNDLKDTQVLVNLAETEIEDDEEDDTTSSAQPSTGEMLWLTLGSILFAVVVLAVVILLLVRRYVKKHPKPAKAKGRPTYDRANVNAPRSSAPKTKVDKESSAVEVEADINRFSDENASAPQTEENSTSEETQSDENNASEDAQSDENNASEETQAEENSASEDAHTEDDNND